MAFNPQQFLGQTITGPMSTRITQCPEGEWMAAVSTNVPIEDWFDEAVWKDKKTGQERRQATAKIPMEILSDDARKQADRETLIVSYDMFLDQLSDGNLDSGKNKNVRLGALREALGQNHDPAWTWQKLFGAGPLMVKVVHTKDEKRGDDTFAKISRVAPIK